MGSTPLVSVVIPAFNDARFIAQTIESVLQQTHSELEIVVVDDGSGDETAAVVRAFGGCVRLCEQQNSGAAVARNRGIEESRGEYIAFLDADDFWHPRKLEAQLRHLQSCRRCVAVYCTKIEVPAESSPDWGRYPWTDAELERVSGNPDASGWLYRQLLLDSIVHTSTIMVPRANLDTIGRFDPSFRKGQDLDYWLRLSQTGPIHMLESVLSAYRINPASITHRTVPTNYHALVIEKAVRRYGLSDPSGDGLKQQELDRVLSTSWTSFAYQHYRYGSLTTAWSSVRRSLAYRPLDPRSWRLAIRVGAKAMLPKSARVRKR